MARLNYSFFSGIGKSRIAQDEGFVHLPEFSNFPMPLDFEKSESAESAGCLTKTGLWIVCAIDMRTRGSTVFTELWLERRRRRCFALHASRSYDRR